jgi:hypothetical protein
MRTRICVASIRTTFLLKWLVAMRTIIEAAKRELPLSNASLQGIVSVMGSSAILVPQPPALRIDITASTLAIVFATYLV